MRFSEVVAGYIFGRSPPDQNDENARRKHNLKLGATAIAVEWISFASLAFVFFWVASSHLEKHLTLPKEEIQKVDQIESRRGTTTNDGMADFIDPNRKPDTTNIQASQDSKDNDSRAISKLEREHRDLFSQEGMWRAANALVWLTVFQVFVGGLTVIFLIKTFQTQRKELGAAARSASAAERAEKSYVFPVVEASFIPFDEPDVSRTGHFKAGKHVIFVRIRVKNFGKTPVRSGRIDSLLLHTGNVEQRGVVPFPTLSSEQHSDVLREFKLDTENYLSNSISANAHIFILTDFRNAAGDSQPQIGTACFVQLTKDDGTAIAENILNDMPWNTAKVLISGVRIQVMPTEVALP